MAQSMEINNGRRISLVRPYGTKKCYKQTQTETQKTLEVNTSE
jgi:hypothetical protein